MRIALSTHLSFGGHAHSSHVSPVVSSLFLISADMALTGGALELVKETECGRQEHSLGIMSVSGSTQVLMRSNREPWPGQFLTLLSLSVKLLPLFIFRCLLTMY